MRESPPASTLIRLLGRNGAGEDTLTLSARSAVQVGMPLPGFQVGTDPIGTLNKLLGVAKSIKIPIRSVMVEESIHRNLKFAKHIELSALKPGKRKTPSVMASYFEWLELNPKAFTFQGAPPTIPG
ncbi:hypothetical protein AX16_010351 [Volvariella volvacea WC 439]|nr:hypothetical protein AX16_010351 [Volvariella volvacea WC 439]